MKPVHRRQTGKGAFDLIEEAVHLLRTAPIATWAGYYLGGIPFVLGLLYFWADMSRSPFAHQHVAEASLGLAGLFLWMKFQQALFARRLRAHIALAPPPRWGFRQCARVFLAQAIVQPSGLFILPLALIPALPFAWVYAFYQNATALAEGEPSDATKLARASWSQAQLWPRQNHILLAVLSGFGFCVFLNWAAVCLAAPLLIKMFFGIESVFTRSPFAMLNTTFLAALIGLTYLCVDPILKAVFVLRCFYGESLKSGEDLKAELKSLAVAQKLAAVMVVSMAFLGTSSAAQTSSAERTGKAARVPTAAPASPATTLASPQVSPPGISAPELDRAINETIHESKYTWRMPREKIVEAESEKGFIGKFLEKISTMLRKWIKATREWLNDLLRKLFQRKHQTDSDGSGYGWRMVQELLLYGLVGVAVLALAWLIYRVWRGRRPAAPPVATEALAITPDIRDENVGADQLPEDGWTQLARDLLARGEFRLAMRALYLASLAHLAARHLISLARFKSNRDYERELRRRGHSFPDLLAVFGDNVMAFERIWYGTHKATLDSTNQFAAKVERIKGAGFTPQA